MMQAPPVNVFPTAPLVGLVVPRKATAIGGIEGGCESPIRSTIIPQREDGDDGCGNGSFHTKPRSLNGLR
jgi:hypothetical protein